MTETMEMTPVKQLRLLTGQDVLEALREAAIAAEINAAFFEEWMQTPLSKGIYNDAAKKLNDRAGIAACPDCGHPCAPHELLEIAGLDLCAWCTTPALVGEPGAESPLMTIAEVARKFRVDGTTVRRWIKQGTLEAVVLPHLKERQAYRVHRDTVEKMLHMYASSK